MMVAEAASANVILFLLSNIAKNLQVPGLLQGLLTKFKLITSI